MKKIGGGFGENAGEWTGRVELAKEETLAVSVACVAVYWPTRGFKGRTFQLCVLIRWDFNFCVRSGTLISVSAAPHCRVKLWALCEADYNINFQVYTGRQQWHAKWPEYHVLMDMHVPLHRTQALVIVTIISQVCPSWRASKPLVFSLWHNTQQQERSAGGNCSKEKQKVSP